MKRLDMIEEITYIVQTGVDEDAPSGWIAARILAVVERFGMEPPVILKKGESDGPGEGQLVNEWED